jgi:hypothetical protein
LRIAANLPLVTDRRYCKANAASSAGPSDGDDDASRAEIIAVFSSKADEMVTLPGFANRFCATWRAGKRAALQRALCGRARDMSPTAALRGIRLPALMSINFSSIRSRGGRGQTAFQARGIERTRLGDQPPRGIHLLPDVPQQHAAHTPFAQVVDHAFVKRLLPVGHRF